jgi:hypothetical protein
MPKLIPTQTIIVEAGERGQPEIGKPFNFTAEEVKDIKRMNPEALREPVNEGGNDDDEGSGSGQGSGSTSGSANTTGVEKTKADLTKEAEALGVKVEKSWNKTQIQDAIDKANKDKKADLVKRAEVANLEVDPEWDLETLEAKVVEAEGL